MQAGDLSVAPALRSSTCMLCISTVYTLKFEMMCEVNACHSAKYVS
jgi:hypothetical protein